MVKRYLLKIILLCAAATLFFNRASAQYAQSGAADPKLVRSVYWLTFGDVNPTYNGNGNTGITGSTLISAPTGYKGSSTPTQSGVDSVGPKIVPGLYIWQFSPTVQIKATIGAFDFGATPNKNRVSSYTPGTESQDRLNILFNAQNPAGNFAVANSGIAGPYGGIVTFDISMNIYIKINGTYVDTPYPGVVIADGETLASAASGEYFGAETTNAIKFQLLAEIFQPATNYSVQPNALYTTADADDYKLTLSNNATKFVIKNATGQGNYGICAVMFAANAKAFHNVTMVGEGRTAIALGFVLPFDLGDNPASYGFTGNYIDAFVINNQFKTDGTYSINSQVVSATLAPNATVYIGAPVNGVATVDGDGQQLGNAYSSVDDSTGVFVSGTSGPVVNDENSLTRPTIRVNQDNDLVLTLPSVTNGKASAGKLYAWVDLNGDGFFSPSEEKEDVVAASSTGVSHAFTYPKSSLANLKVGALYTRFRVTTSALTDSLASAVDERALSYAADGETEDYRLDVAGLGISGTVFDDPNGNTDGVVSGTATAKAGTAQLYAYLANGTSSTSLLVSKVQVATDGTFAFTGVANGTYTVAISTNATVTINGTNTLAAVPATLPTTYIAAGASYGTNNVGHTTDAIQTGVSNLQITVTTPASSLDVTGLKLAIDQVPTATGDGGSIQPSATITIPVADNDSDPEGNTTLKKSSIRLVDPANPAARGLTFTLANKGTFTVDTTGTGKVSFTSLATFSASNSPAVITYTIRDAAGAESNAANITITYAAGPSAVADQMVTTINTQTSKDLRTNDGNTNGTVDADANTAKGGTTTKTNNVITYTPPNNFTGKDSFTYTLTDGTGTSARTPVTVSVKPVGIADSYTTNAGTAIATVDVTTNDGASGTNTGTTVTNISIPTKGGTASLNAGTKVITYTPPANFVGKDTFTYTLTTADSVVSDPIKVTIGVKPLGSADDFTTTINTSATQAVKTNDANGTAAGIIVKPLATTVNGGTTNVDANGVVSYTPANNFIGNDAYTYTLTTADTVASNAIAVVVHVKPTGVADNYFTPINTAVQNPVKTNDGASGTATGVVLALGTTQPTKGVVTLNSDGQGFLYTPNTGASGTDTYTYTLTSSAATGSVRSDQILATVLISANGVADTYSTPINTPITFDVKANDGTFYTNATITAATPTTKGGTTSVTSDQKVLYTPASGFVGKDKYTYTLTQNGTTTAPINVTVNVLPTGVNDTYVTRTNVPITNTVKDNDGPSGTVAGIILALGTTAPTNGRVALNTAGTAFVYTPNNNFAGTDTYTYTLTTADTVSSAQITVTENILSAGAADAAATLINTPVNIDVKVNDGSDNANATVTPTPTTTKGGTAVNDGTDKVVYTPASNFSGIDTFTYTLTTSGSISSPLTVTVRVKPTGVNDTYSTAAGVAVVNTVKDNDGAGANGTTLASVTQPAHGAISAPNTANTTFTYTPTAGYVGTDTYTYTLTTADGVVSDPITVTINIVTPGANGTNDADITAINTAKSTNVKANDGTTFASAAVTPSAASAKGGTIANDGNGNLIYTPPAGFTGKDTYTYTLTNTGGTPTAPVTVTMSVKPVGVRDVYNTGINTAIVNSVKDNDGPSATGTTVAVATTPLHGTVAANTANTSFTYTPTTGYVGVDTYTYTLTTADGVVSDPITVVVNIANSGTSGALTTGGTPDADLTLVGTPRTTNVKANDGTSFANATVTPTATSAKGGTIANDGTGNLIYTPATGFTGIDTYTYTLTNAGGTPTQPITVTMTVRPVGVNDNYSTATNVAVVNTVKDNDGASANNTTVKVVDPPIYGTVAANTANTSFTYTPAAGLNGTDTYTYSLTTADGVVSAPVTVNVAIAAPATAGTPDTETTIINTPVTTNVKANDGTTFTNAAVTPTPTTTKGGTAVNDGTDKVTYTPPVNFSGKDTYTYTLTNAGGTPTAPVTVSVSVKPTGVNDTYSTAVGVAVVNTVKDNDGAGANGTTLASVTQPAHGAISAPNTANTTFTYTPTAGYVGTDTYTYTLTTADGVVSDPITVTINIVTPGANGTNDADITAINTAKSTNVKANDGTTFASAAVTPSAASAKGGTIANDGNGNLIYTPPAGFTGKDTYTYTLTNTGGTPTAPVTVTMSVKPVGVRDVYNTGINTAIVNSVKDNDGPSATGTTVAVATTPLHGTVAANTANTSFTYTPTTGYVGVDTYTYTLTTADGVVSDPITVVVNIANSGTSGALTTGGTPDADLTLVGTPRTTNVKANDGTSFANATVTPTATSAKGGTIANDGTGNLIYTPATGFTGIDTYTYTLTNAGGTPTQPITVTMTVRPVGVNDNYSTATNVAVVNTVKDNDGASANNTTVKVVDPPIYGTVAANTANTSFTYTPAAGLNGTDTYTYSLTTADGVVSAPVTVNVAIAAPATAGTPDTETTIINTPVTTNVKANDGTTFTNAAVTPTPTTTKGGTAVNDGTDKVTYTPPVNFSGKDTYTYTLTNAGGTPTAPVTVSVSVKPTGVNDTYSTAVGVAVVNTVKDNDGAGANGTTLASVTQPAHGAISAPNTANTTFTYTPTAGYVGTDTYTYTLTTADGVVSDPITVTINIVTPGANGTNDADITAINTAKSTNVKANDGTTFASAAVTPSAASAKGGTIANDGNGNLIYTPPAGFTGKDTYTYTLTNTGGTPTAPVTVTMSVKPVGVRDVYNTGINTAIVNSVKDNDGPSATGTTVAVATTPLHGTVAANTANTSFTYTPTTGYVGVDTYTYTLTTADGVVSDPITVVVNIANSGTSGALTTGGTPDADLTLVGTPRTTNVKANDGTSFANATVTPTATSAKGGTIANDGTGNLIYTPATGFTGIDTYTYTLTNAGGTPTQPITVTMTVRPVGVNDNYSTATNVAVVNTVKDNDGASANNTTVKVVDPPIYGTVAANTANTSFTYTPAAGLNGTDTYTYSLTTADGVVSAPVTVNVAIAAPATAGTPDTETTIINTPVTTNVKANDGTTFTNAAVTPTPTTTKGGTAVNDGTDKVTYTPPVNFSGKDTYTYTLTNAGGTPTAPVTVSVSVKPTGVNDTYSTAVGVAVVNTVKDNDGAGANGTTLASVTQPAHGAISAPNTANTTFTYTPTAGYVGTDTYTYTLTTADGVVSDPITVTINIVTPGANGTNDADITAINTAKSTNVKANDGTTFASAAVTPSAASAKGGTIANDGNGNLIYTPPAGFTGKDTYTYTLTNTGGTPTAPVTVTMSVKPVGVRDVYNTGINTAIVNSVKDNDGPSATGTTVAVATTPLHGTVAANTANTSFTYTPTTGYVGVDTYTYTLTTADGVVSDPITVVVNIANSGTSGALTTGGTPDADLTLVGTPRTTNVKANDGTSFANATVTPTATSAKGGTIANDGTGNLIYTPATGFTGIDTYTYTLTNAGGTPTQPITVTMTVRPVGVNDNYSTATNVAVVNTVKDNDGASANNTTVKVVDPPIYGTVAANTANTSFTYTPAAGLNGTDTYTYSLTTADGVVSAPVTVNVAIAAPVGTGTPDTDATTINTPKTTNVKANDGNTFTNATVTPTPISAKGGTVTNDGTGNLIYTPPTGFIGKDTYTYTLTNTGSAPTSPITVTINVKPVGVNDTYSTALNTSLQNDVKVNDGASATGTTVATATAPLHGTAVPNSTNTLFTYTPTTGYTGADTYTYTLTTADGVVSDPITVNITISGAGVPDVANTPINTAVTIDVKNNDGTAFTNATVTPTPTTTKGGTAANDGTGKVIYTPPTGFIGKDTFTYTLTNTGSAPSAPVTVTVSVKPVGVNDNYATAVSTAVTTDVKVNDGASAINTTVAVASAPQHGTAVPNAANTLFTYTPTTGYTGIDTYTYTLTTADGVVSDPITVNILISGSGVPDAVITTVGTPVTTDVKANDGPNYTNATVTPTPTTSKGGTAVNDGTGKVIYTPPTGFTGKDTYTYTLTNTGSTPSTPVLVQVSVKPVGVNDTYSTAVNTAIANDVKVNDGVSATGTTVATATSPLHGTAVPNSTNTLFTYTPTTGYTGTDTYTYTLTTADGVVSDPITVTITIVAPGVNGTPDTDVTLINTSKTTNVKANDGATYTNATVTPTPTSTKGGSIINDGTGNLIYTPPTGFIGKDTYTYTLTNTGSAPTSPITVTINVKPVGVNDTYATSVNTTIPNDVKVNDGASATGTTVAVVTSPLHGTVIPNSSNTLFTYTPATGYVGTDTYTYTLNTADGVVSDPITVNITITTTSLGFTKVATSGASAAGDVISYALVVTNNGAAPVTNIRVTDAGADAGSISPASVATLAAGASTTVTAKHTVTAADVAAGSYSNQASVVATDINGNQVSKPKSDNPATVAVDDPTVVQILPKGAITLNKTGVADFTSITYTFTITNTGTVSLNNISLTDALLNITNSPITVTGGLAPGAKTTVTFKYTLTQADRDAAKVINAASISSLDANNNTVTNTATVTNTVPPSPTAMPDPISTQIGAPITITPSKNDAISGAAFVAIEILSQPKHGTLKVNADLTVTYTPDPGYSGPDSFTYRLRDLNGFYTNAAAVAISDGFVNNLTIPNTFTPNGDGVNDTFEIIGIENYPTNELIIINRWGNEVYHKTNYTKEWTGEGLNEGTYYFLLHIKNSDGSDLEVIKGYISLIRNKVN